jgi:hypothetical protein
VVTSTGVRDAGLFQPAARDERYAPFEGAGAISAWQLTLPAELRRFDYSTIADAVLHLDYTARPGVRQDAVVADLQRRFAAATERTLARSISLRHDLPSAWAAFQAGQPLSARMDKEWLPYYAQTATVTVQAVELYGISGSDLTRGPSPVDAAAAAALTQELAETGACTVAVPEDGAVVRRDGTADPYLVVRYTIS